MYVCLCMNSRSGAELDANSRSGGELAVKSRFELDENVMFLSFNPEHLSLDAGIAVVLSTEMVTKSVRITPTWWRSGDQYSPCQIQSRRAPKILLSHRAQEQRIGVAELRESCS